MSEVPSDREIHSHGEPPPATKPGNPQAAGIPLARPMQLYPPAADAPQAVARPAQRLPMPMSRLRAIIELAAIALVFCVGAVVVGMIAFVWPPADRRWVDLVSTAVGGASAVCLGILLLRFANHKPLTIGWTRKQFAANVGLGLMALMATYLAFFSAVLIGILFDPDLIEDPNKTQRVFAETFPPISLGVLAAMMPFVVLWEEIIFRGFVLTRLQAILRRWWLTLPVGAALFGLPHYWEGYLAMVIVSVLGLVMGTLFVWRKSLVAPIAFHLANNLIFLIIVRIDTSTWQ